LPSPQEIKIDFKKAIAILKFFDHSDAQCSLEILRGAGFLKQK